MPENKLTDQEIVEGICAKKAAAFNYFYDRYAGAYFGEIKKTLTREEIACEILEKVFQKHLDEYRQL